MRLGITCPICGTGGQIIGPIKCLRQRCTMNCKHCGSMLSSNLSITTYILLELFSSAVLAVVAVPFVLALVAKSWASSLVIGLLYILFIFALHLILHARHVTAEGVSKGTRFFEE
jgi:hypothetical protein